MKMKQYNITITEEELQSLISALKSETCRLTSEMDELKRKQLERSEKHPINQGIKFLIDGKLRIREQYSNLSTKLSRIEAEA